MISFANSPLSGITWNRVMMKNYLDQIAYLRIHVWFSLIKFIKMGRPSPLWVAPHTGKGFLNWKN